MVVDDCELTARLWQGKNPLRIVIDRKLSLPVDRKIFNALAKTFVFNQVETKTDASTDFVQIDFSKNVLEQVLRHLLYNEIQSVIIEGGPDTLQHFITQNLWDEARIFTSPQQLKEGKTSPAISGQVIEETEIETDKLKVIINNTL